MKALNKKEKVSRGQKHFKARSNGKHKEGNIKVMLYIANSTDSS